MKRGRLDQHRLAGARTLACRRRRICAAGRARARAAAPETVVRASPGLPVRARTGNDAHAVVAMQAWWLRAVLWLGAVGASSLGPSPPVHA